MKFNFITYLFFFLYSSTYVYSQSISGVVNNYAEITSVGTDEVEVADVSGFQVGDKVLIIQMKGATITTGNIAGFGTVTALNNAGNFEFSVIASINASTIVFETELCKSYDASASVQLVRIPVYTDVTISDVLTAEPWDGTIGGIVAIEATGSITFNSSIDVSGMGFRGGEVFTGSFGCGDPNWATTNSGKKGEGIANAPIGQEGNRAPLANGGGGSNTGNPGAGGGANGGAGGRGGNEWFGSCALNVSYGIGGYELDYTAHKAFLGGGGGGGYRDNGLNATEGANGGGIVFLISPLIQGNNSFVNVSGGNVMGTSDSEGAGGGGAGGCVYLMSNSINSQLDIYLNGGSGGDIFSTLWQSACHGPGGGGGGGALVLESSNIPANVNASISGGNSGMVLHTGPACAGTSHSASVGFEGQIIYDYTLPVFPDLGVDTVVCVGDTIQLLLNTSFDSYLWNTGSTEPSLMVDVAGDYWVDVETSCGVVRDSILVSQNNINLGSDQEICPGVQTLLEVPLEFPVQSWNTGEVSQSILADTSGTYIVVVTDELGCILTDSVVISVLPEISSNVTDSICLGDGYDFNGVMLYNGGLYIDTMISLVGGCDSIINLTLTALELPSLVVQDTSVCLGSEVLLIPQGASFYEWIPATGNLNSDGSLMVLGSETNWYVVVGTDQNNCSSTDSLLLTVFSLPDSPALMGDASYCINEIPLSIEASGSSGNYIWYMNDSFNEAISYSSSYIPDNILGNTTYYVSAVENGCESESEFVNIIFEICDIMVPSAFTPDDDEVNDIWELKNIDLIYPNNVVTVFNRWGNKVYTSTKGDYNSRPWDGFYGNQVLPVSSYYFIIEFNDNLTKSQLGAVSIIR